MGAAEFSFNKFDSRKQNRFLGCLRKGLRMGEACRAAGISRCTVWAYAKAFPEFKAKMDKAEEAYCDVVEKHLLKAVKKLNTTAMIFWLTNRSPDRWRDRRAVLPTTNAITISQTPEEIKAALEEALAKQQSVLKHPKESNPPEKDMQTGPLNVTPIKGFGGHDNFNSTSSEEQ